jgi:hypothetical protein
MAYESQYKPVYYQRTSTGRPREAKDSELNQISNSLKNFNKSFAKFTDNYKTEQQNEAQDVFDNLKAQGITDPDEIKKLIDNNDPRVANLKGYYTQAVVNSNFGLSHAIEDFNLVQTKVNNITGGDEKGDAMANLNIDSLFQSVNENNEPTGNPIRDLSTQDKSYTRAYTDSMNQMRLQLEEKQSIAKGLQLNRQTNASAFQIIAKSWEQGGAWSEEKAVGPGGSEKETIFHSSSRVQDLEKLRTDKVVNEKFINKDEWNKQVLNYFEQVVDLQDTGLITDPGMLDDIVTYLTMKRGSKKDLPSYLRTPKTQEQATKIIDNIKGKVAGSSKMAIAMDLISKGHAYKKDEVTYVNKSGEVKVGLSDEDMADAIVLWSTQYARPLINQQVADGDVPKEYAEMGLFQLTSKMLDSNGLTHPTWKNELSMGFTSLNVIKVAGNADTLDPDGINIFERGLERFRKLNLNYGGKIPGKYLSTEEASFYTAVDNLMRNTNMGKEAAIMKAYEATTNPAFNHADKALDKAKITESITDSFNGWFDEMTLDSPFSGLYFINAEDESEFLVAENRRFRWEDVNMSMLQQRAIMTAMTMYKSGSMKLEDAVKYGIEEVVSRHTLIDGVMVNNSSFPNVSRQTFTENSRYVAKQFAKVWMDKYKDEGRLDSFFEEGAFNPFKANESGQLKHYAKDLVMRPFKSGFFVLTEKDNGLPVTTPDGDFVVLSTKDFIMDDGKLAESKLNKKDLNIILKNSEMMKELNLDVQSKVNKKDK